MMASYNVEISDTDSMNNALFNLTAATGFVRFTAESLSKRTASKLREAFSSLPPSVITVSLSATSLGRLSTDELIEACSGFPETVSTLDLSSNDLGAKSRPELEKLIAFLAERFSMDWSNNNFDKKTAAELKTLLSSLSAKTTFVDLSAMRLFLRSTRELREIFSGIAAQVDSLDLSDNELYKKTGAELQASFFSLAADLRSLYLCFNELGNNSGSELNAIFAALSASHVDLSYNKLGYKRDFELSLAFSGFRPEVKSLRLSRNGFAEQKTEKLKNAFSALPSTLSAIDFSDDAAIKQLNNKELVAFLRAIPLTVRFIDLSHNKLFKARTAKERDELLLELKAIDPDGSRISLAHNGKPIINAVKATPTVEQARQQPREILHSILQFIPKKESVVEKVVSKFSFFSQLKAVKEIQQPDPILNEANKPTPS